MFRFKGCKVEDDVTDKWIVEVHVEGGKIDRRNTFGWSVVDSDMADRLVRAIDAGVAVTEGVVMRDAMGKTYLNVILQVSGRNMDADLTRLGF
jgi:hypothetical protein